MSEGVGSLESQSIDTVKIEELRSTIERLQKHSDLASTVRQLQQHLDTLTTTTIDTTAGAFLASRPNDDHDHVHDVSIPGVGSLGSSVGSNDDHRREICTRATPNAKESRLNPDVSAQACALEGESMSTWPAGSPRA